MCTNNTLPLLSLIANRFLHLPSLLLSTVDLGFMSERMRSFRKKVLLLCFAVLDVPSFRVQIGANFLKTRVDFSLCDRRYNARLWPSAAADKMNIFIPTHTAAAADLYLFSVYKSAYSCVFWRARERKYHPHHVLLKSWGTLVLKNISSLTRGVDLTRASLKRRRLGLWYFLGYFKIRVVVLLVPSYSTLPGPSNP